jgi:hypothetical protein
MPAVLSEKSSVSSGTSASLMQSKRLSADKVSAIGMGIEFVEVESNDRSILYNWLPEKS